MSIFQAILLGIVQGATEFIPVSSSAHLVLVPWLLGWKFDPQAAFVFDVLVQLGTLVAVIAYFWRDVWGSVRAVLAGLWVRRPFEASEARLGWLVVLATIPAVVLGFAFHDFFEGVFGNPVGVAALLSGSALLLIIGERVRQLSPRAVESLNWRDALYVGLAQAFAILPGISRSGSTIAGGLARGLDRRSAARFSFLMSVPVMLGAGVVTARDLLAAPNFGAQLPTLAAGFVAAAIVGYASIRWLLGYLSRRTLYGFAVYCGVASLACLGVAFLR